MLKLSDILGSGGPLQWYESVALVREVVERQLEGSDERPLVPALHQVQLSADGEVTLLGGNVVDEPVRRMGQMLQAILSHSDPPVSSVSSRHKPRHLRRPTAHFETTRKRSCFSNVRGAARSFRRCMRAQQWRCPIDPRPATRRRWTRWPPCPRRRNSPTRLK